MVKRNLIVAVITVITVVMGWRAYIYLRYSESRVRSRVLATTPLGTSFETAEVCIRRRGWEITAASRTRGFFDQRIRPGKIAGTMYLRASVATYYDVLRKDISVYWGFDENGQLIDIWVWITTDAL